MLPSFDERGYLPHGVHNCTLEQLATRFGSGSPERQAGTAELREFVRWAKAAGVIRLVVDDSFVTDQVAPNDVDVVILPGPDYRRDQQPALACGQRWPFLHVQVATNEADFQEWVAVDFGIDRDYNSRGVAEILL